MLDTRVPGRLLNSPGEMCYNLPREPFSGRENAAVNFREENEKLPLGRIPPEEAGDLCCFPGIFSERTEAESMKSILIRDTTKAEREKIVAEAVGALEAACDGCAPGIIRMYDDYIEGKKNCGK